MAGLCPLRIPSRRDVFSACSAGESPGVLSTHLTPCPWCSRNRTSLSWQRWRTLDRGCSKTSLSWQRWRTLDRGCSKTSLSWQRWRTFDRGCSKTSLSWQRWRTLDHGCSRNLESLTCQRWMLQLFDRQTWSGETKPGCQKGSSRIL